MHVLIGKRQLVLAALVAALGLAVFVNWYFTGSGARFSPEGQAANEAGTAENGAAEFVSAEQEQEYFAAVKLNRETALSAALEELQTVTASADADGTDLQAVREKVAKLTSAAKTESDIESLITAQLGGDCVAVLGENGVDVIVSRENFNDTAVLQISDIVRSVCGAQLENVRVASVMA